MPRLISNDFLDQAVSGLAEDGKVICVRLALFAEMMKGKPWTPAYARKRSAAPRALASPFLEETFSCSHVPTRSTASIRKPPVRSSKPCSRNQGTDIKGNMRSRQELMEASGYGDRPKDFEDLIRILDSEIRLITPTDPEGSESADDSNAKVEAGQKYYQLTHDYLVPSLREWLTRKQKETRRGRAELRLADRAALWNAKPENRHLPSLWEFLNIRLLTDKKKWTAPQRKMMGKAGRVHGIRCGIAAAVLAVCRAVVLGRLRRSTADFRRLSLVKRLVAADIAEVPGIVQELDGYRRWADPLLRQEDAQAEQGSNQEAAFGSGTPARGSKQGCRIAGRFTARVAEPVCRRAGRSVALQGQRGGAAVERGPGPEARGPAAISSSLCLGDLCSRRPALEPDQHLRGWSSGDAGGVGPRGVAGGPASGQGATDQAARLDLSGHKSERTVSQLRHGDAGGLCRRPARRIVRPAGRRRAISVPGRCSTSWLAHKDKAVALARPGTPRTTTGKSERGSEGTPGEAAGQRRRGPVPAGKPTTSGRCSSSVPIRGFAATSFTGSVRWEAIRRRSSNDSTPSPT